MQNNRRGVLALVAVATAGAFSGASAQPITSELTVLDDFEVSTVFRSLFGGTGRSFLTNQARYQVNGDSLISGQSPLGIYTVFDIDGSTLQPPGGAVSVDEIVFNLTSASRISTGSGGVQTAGNLLIYFTTDNADLNLKEFNTDGFTDATGLTGQFADLTLLSSGFQDVGVYDFSRTLDISGVSGDILDAINNGDNLRFIIASDTPAAVFQFATGLPDPSPIFDFFGEPTTIDITVTAGGAACPPDLNGDGVVDADDFFLFLQLFAAGDPVADFNNDGVIDADDFFAFLSAFATGC